MIDINTKQYKLIAKMYTASLIEAAGDHFIREPGVCQNLTTEQIKEINNEMLKIAQNLRGSWPVFRSMSDIIQYLTGTATDTGNQQ